MKNQQKFVDVDALCASLGGTSESIQKLITTIKTIPSDQPSTILIYGEPGTEKELIAKFIHTGLKNDSNRFIILNCFLIPGSSIQKELAHHLRQLSAEKDQTDSTTTLLFHKINRLQRPVLSQLSTLLRTTAEENRLRIMATIDFHSGQSAEETGICKELDRYFHGYRITIPSLKERKEDIPLLLETLSNYYCRKFNQKQFAFSAHVTAILTEYPWQGNIRELKGLVKYLVLRNSGRDIGTSELPVHFRHRPAYNQPWSNLQTKINWDHEQIDFRQRIDQFETELIVAAMRRSGGNMMEAARLLNLKRTTLLEKIKKKGINHLWKE